MRTLAGFDKVILEAGEKKSVTIPIRRDGLSTWDDKRDYWCIEAGKYTVEVVTGEGALEEGFEVTKDVYWSGL